MSQIPVAKICPSCQATSYSTCQPASKVAFTKDRVCSSCGTRYSPPCPKWAAVLFALLGIVMAIIFAYLMVFNHRQGIHLSFSTLLHLCGIGFGIATISYGIRSLATRVDA